MILARDPAADEEDEQRKRDDLALLLLLLAEIAADHDERERGLIALFLATAKRALKRVREAIRGGHNWLKSLWDVFRGNPVLSLPDPAPILAAGMSDSFTRGQWRAARLAGVLRPYAGLPGGRVSQYLSEAERALDGTALALENRITGLLDEAPNLPGAIEAIAEAFRLAGWAVDNPWGAKRAAANAVLPAYSGGMAAAYADPEVAEKITGLKWVSILDPATTKICTAYAGVQLPATAEWWRRHWPPAHFSCRSVVLPIIGDFEPTLNPPEIPPPMDGFGIMPPLAWARTLASA